jgi:hypothetical protein
MSPRKKKAPAARIPLPPSKDKVFTRSQVAKIFNVDPKTASRWAGNPADKNVQQDVMNGKKLDFITTPAGTKRYLGESLVASGVCRNCWTLPSSIMKSCECGARALE